MRTRNKKKVLIIVFFIFITCGALVGTIFRGDYNIGNSPELSFSETSSEKKIIGSVLPASCESYPGMTIYHYTGDTNGHCPGTCPGGAYIAYEPWWKQCSYMAYDFSYYNETVAPDGSCSSPSGWLVGEAIITASVCKINCSNGTSVYPHRGESCPIPTPTVNIWFQ